MRFAVLDSNGIILRVGTCVDEDLDLQAEDGQTVRQIDESISDLTHQWVDGGFVRIELVAKNILTDVRRFRGTLLKSCDWTQMPDAPFTEQKKAEWATYRQALRDLTTTYSEAASLEDVVFPTAPEA